MADGICSVCRTEFGVYDLDLLSDGTAIHHVCRKAGPRVEALETALSWFLTDPRFQVAVGGNPKAVDNMLTVARRVLHALPIA